MAASEGMILARQLCSWTTAVGWMGRRLGLREQETEPRTRRVQLGGFPVNGVVPRGGRVPRVFGVWVEGDPGVKGMALEQRKGCLGFRVSRFRSLCLCFPIVLRTHFLRDVAGQGWRCRIAAAGRSTSPHPRIRASFGSACSVDHFIILR